MPILLHPVYVQLLIQQASGLKRIDRQCTELSTSSLLYQASAPERIGCLWMSNIIGRKCTEPCIAKRIVWIHHWILGLWIGRLEWSKRIHLMLRRHSHLHGWRGRHGTRHDKWISNFERIRGWLYIYWLLRCSICSYIIQTIEREGVQSTSLLERFRKNKC